MKDKYTIIYQTTDDEVEYCFIETLESQTISEHIFQNKLFKNGERINFIFYGHCFAIKL